MQPFSFRPIQQSTQRHNRLKHIFPRSIFLMLESADNVVAAHAESDGVPLIVGESRAFVRFRLASVGPQPLNLGSGL